MVRRERLLRQVRERVDMDLDTRDETLPVTFRERVRNFAGFQPRSTRRMVSSVSGQQMTQFDADRVPGPATSSARLGEGAETETARIQSQTQPRATASHRGWAQQRALNMLGPRAPEDPEAVESRTTPGWRKLLRGMFPGR